MEIDVPLHFPFECTFDSGLRLHDRGQLRVEFASCLFRSTVSQMESLCNSTYVFEQVRLYFRSSSVRFSWEAA